MSLDIHKVAPFSAKLAGEMRAWTDVSLVAATGPDQNAIGAPMRRAVVIVTASRWRNLP